MAEIGTVSAEEADAAIARYEGFARYWGKKTGLKFADGRYSLMYRLITHRKS